MDFTYKDNELGLAAELFQSNYDDLVIIARARRRRSNRNQTLATIDILHESFIRLNKNTAWESREHFINAAALAIRNVIIDYARKKKAAKRDFGKRTDMNAELMPEFWESSEQIIQISDLMDKLKIQNSRWMRIVDARYFCGFTEDETADILKLGATTIGRDATADGSLALAVGLQANASAGSSTALGSQAEASGNFSTAIGRSAVASGNSALALGRDSEADDDSSTAIGFGASTTLANQMMLGTISTTYVMPGITSATSLARQGVVTGILTTDANGNLASDGGALEARVTALEGSPMAGAIDSPVAEAPVATARATEATPVSTSSEVTGTVKSAEASTSAQSTTSKSVTAETIATSEPIAEASHIAVSETGELSVVDSNNRGEAILTETDMALNVDDAVGSTGSAPQTVSSDVIGSNLTTVKETTATTPVAYNSVVAETVEVNASNIAVNTANISANSERISGNALAIASNTTAIQANSDAILGNTQAINDLRNGSAALASIPDLYLGSDETWSIAGGLALYDDGFGGSETGFGGGIQMRSSKSDKWSVGISGALSGDAGVVRLQGRIGG